MNDFDEIDEYAEPTGTPLDCVRTAFQALLDADDQMVLSGDELGHGLPARDIPLAELKDILMSAKTRTGAKRAIWAAVIDGCRDSKRKQEWILVATGLAYPGLAGHALKICQAAPGDVHDIQAELLAEFVESLGAVDVNDPDVEDIAGWLCFRAVNGSWKARTALEDAGVVVRASVPDSAAPSLQVGHPDIVLARAVRRGVLTAREAEMLGRLYLEGQSAGKVARDMMPRGKANANRTKTRGVSTATFYRYRNEVTARLAAAIEAGTLRSY